MTASVSWPSMTGRIASSCPGRSSSQPNASRAVRRRSSSWGWSVVRVRDSGGSRRGGTGHRVRCVRGLPAAHPDQAFGLEDAREGLVTHGGAARSAPGRTGVQQRAGALELGGAGAQPGAQGGRLAQRVEDVPPTAPLGVGQASYRLGHAGQVPLNHPRSRVTAADDTELSPQRLLTRSRRPRAAAAAWSRWRAVSRLRAASPAAARCRRAPLPAAAPASAGRRARRRG